MIPSALYQFGEIYLNLRCYSIIQGSALQVWELPQKLSRHMPCKSMRIIITSSAATNITDQAIMTEGMSWN